MLDQRVQRALALGEPVLGAPERGDVGVAADGEHRVRVPVLPYERALHLHHQAAPAQCAERRRVCVEDFAGDIDEDDEVGGAIEQCPEAITGADHAA